MFSTPIIFNSVVGVYTYCNFLQDILFSRIYPILLNIRDTLRGYDGSLTDEEITKVRDIYVLCSSQVKKCLQTLFDIFKKEYHEEIFMQVSGF